MQGIQIAIFIFIIFFILKEICSWIYDRFFRKGYTPKLGDGVVYGNEVEEQDAKDDM